MIPFIETAVFPADYRAAIDAGQLAAAADLPAASPEAYLARGLVRLTLGREADARSDFTAGGTAACRLELGFLDQRRRVDAKAILALADEAAAGESGDSLLRARANHLAGLAESQQRRLQPATDRLLQAAEIYERLGARGGAAQVNDTLGMILASRGRADLAALHYSLSLSDKALLGDREGLAITLGNLGRLALQVGRFRDAIAFFERDTEILQELKNARAEARLQNDMGRAWRGLEETGPALSALERSLDLAAAGGYWDIWIMSQAEIAQIRMAGRDLVGAAAAVARAKEKLPPEGFTLERAALGSAEGELRALEGDRDGLTQMEAAIESFARARLPDLEVASRLELAETYVALKLERSAEACLYEALKLARGEGLLRYVRPITEALAGLDVTQSVIEEAPRPIAERVAEAGSGYVIRRRLGAGGFGTVFQAFDLEHGRDVALKRIHVGSLYDPAERDRLVSSAKAELEAAATIRHPGIVRVYAVGLEPNGDFYVAQEFIKGEGLDAVMDRSRASGTPQPGEVVPYLQRIAQALAALHGAGVVHRDLKPANVIVRGGWQPILVDFGIAHVPGRAEVAEQNLGTLQYTAPEQAAGEPADAKADLYALGVIAYEWFAGRRPLEIPEEVEQAIRVLRKQDPEPLGRVRPDLPRELTALIDQMLEKKPRRRPDSAAAVAERLAAFAG